MSIKQTIPNAAALRIKLNEQWGDFETKVQEEVGPLEAEYKSVRKRQRMAAACFTAMAVIFGTLDVFSDDDSSLFDLFNGVIGLVLFIVAIPAIIVLGIAGYRLMRDKSNVVARFNSGLNKLIFPKVLSIFGLTGSRIEPTVGDNEKMAVNSKGKSDQKKQSLIFQNKLLSSVMISHSPEYKQVMELLDHSELVTEPRNSVVIDDMLHIPWEDRVLFVSELDLKHVTGSGKNRKVKKIFKGYFVSFDLKRPLQGKTFVSTEGDTKGFGHQSFWKNLKGHDVSVTELEWNEFENLLHVATNNPSEARYVLTTNFMADLYDWWKDKKINIRIAFIGSRMYMLFPDNKIRLKNTVPELKTSTLQEYAMTIGTPLMHVLHLVEEVRN